MKLALAATLAILALVGAGCDEHYTSINKHQVLVQDTDGAVDQSNIAKACHGSQNVAGWQTGSGHKGAVVVTCKGR